MKSSADVEREVEATRGQIDQTVEALKEKMQPRELFDEATRVMGATSNKVLTTVVDQARANPIPIALIGAGVAWLVLSQRKAAAGEDFDGRGYYETYEGYDEDEGFRAKLASKARAAADAAKSKIADARTQASGLAAKAKEGLAGAGDGVDGVKGRAAALASTAQARAGEYGRQAQARFQQTLDTEPLILAALGLAVGAAIGASLPASRVERRYIGPHRDKIVDKGAELARTSLDDAKGIAQRAYGQVKEELHRQTGPEGEGASLTEKAQALADAGVQVVREEVDSRLAH
jgi:hypothetical protein